MLGKAAATPRVLAKAPGTGAEWELVRVAGTVIDVKRSGQAWRAELRLADGTTVPIVGLARAGIAVDRIREGQAGSIVGIVRRAYPSAKDRRFAVLPRSRADLDLGAAASKPAQAAGASHGTSSGGGSGGGSAPGSAGGSAGPGTADDGTTATTIEAAELSANVGRFVRIGGLVVQVTAPQGQGGVSIVVLEDGSGTATLRLAAGAAAIGIMLRPDDLIEARGTVEVDGAGWVIVVDDPADLVVAGQAVALDPSPAADATAVGSGDLAGSPADGPQPDAAVTPLMGAAGAGAIVAMVVAAAAAGARWRRWQRDRLASRDATERLVELLTETPEGPPLA